MPNAGPLTLLVENAGAVMNGGLALAALVTGKVPFDPPIPLRPLFVRIVALCCGVAGAIVWWLSRTHVDTDDLQYLAGGSLITALVLMLAYLFAYMTLCYRCPDDARRYLVGLVLKTEAKRVLAGGHPGDRYGGGPITPPTPSSKRDYFCNSGKDPYFLWKAWSIPAAAVLLCLLYAMLLLAGAIALSASTSALLPADVEVKTKAHVTEVELPADVLFEFDKAEIKPRAELALRRTAAILSARNVRHASIGGHTDGKGSRAYNQLLSERRAAAVYQWLRENAGLRKVRFSVKGYGASQPVAPNVTPQGHDDPEGRARNRRVEIRFASEP